MTYSRPSVSSEVSGGQLEKFLVLFNINFGSYEVPSVKDESFLKLATTLV